MRALETRSCLALTLASILSGCASPPPVPYDPPPIPYVVCVARPAVLEAEEPAARDGIVPVDTEELSRVLVQVLDDLGVCTRIEEVRVSEEGEALAAARRLDADLLVRVEAKSWPRYSLSARSPWYIPNIGLWFLVGLPSWWIRDCIYEVTWTADFGLYSVPGGRALGDEVLAMRGEEALNVTERGWTWRALLTPPAYYHGPDEGKALVPLAEDLLIEQVIELVRNVRGGDESVSIRISHISQISSPGRDAPDRGRYVLPLGIAVRSDRELERFTVELDGQEVPELSHNRLTLPEPAIRADQTGREFEYTFVLEEGALAAFAPRPEHYLRILARSAGASAWSASRTVRLDRLRLSPKRQIK